MKVLYDHQIFSSQVYGGVSKYFAEIINILQNRCDIDISAWISNNQYAKEYNLFKMTGFLNGSNFRGKGLLMEKIGIPYSLYKIRRGDYDLFHATSYDDYCLSGLGSKPLVITYHDVNFLTERDYSAKQVRLQRKYIERADHIIAISENTKKDLLQYFDYPEDKITVAYHGVPQISIPSCLSTRIVPYNYILYVGMRHGYKNFINFVKAFSLISEEYPDIRVICTRNSFSKDECDLLINLGVSDRFVAMPVDETALSRLYRDALFFIYPSIYEGFGMPILEAMQQGCPNVLANASCFPEIAKDAAAYFDPYDIDSISDAMKKVISDNNYRSNIIAAGYKRVLDFSWEKSANIHWDVYRSLVE